MINSALLSQLFRFGLVGAVAAFVHFTVVVFLVQQINLLPLSANIVGFLMGFQVSYWGHRQWTFKAIEILHRSAMPRLLFVQTLNFAANQTLFYFLMAIGLPYPIALFFVLLILPIFTFMAGKLWVFV